MPETLAAPSDGGHITAERSPPLRRHSLQLPGDNQLLGSNFRPPDGYRIELIDRSAKWRSSKPSLDCRDDLVRPRHRRHVADSVEFDELGIGEDLHERPADVDGDDRVGGAVQDQHG